MDTQIIETELVKADITEQTIQKMRDNYLVLKVRDTSDKPGFEAVSTARKEVKKTRVAVEKLMKSIREPATLFQKAVIAKEKEIVGKIAEIEIYLSSQEEIFNPKEVEVQEELTPEEKDMVSLRKLKEALLAYNLPEMFTEEGKKTVFEVRKHLDNVIYIIK